MIVGATLTIAMVSVALMLALPWLDEDPEWAARWLARELAHDVEVERLEVTIEGAVPVLRLSNVRVSSKDQADSAHILALEQVKVELDPLDIVRRGAIHPRRIRIVGAHIGLHRDEDTLLLRGIGDGQPMAADRALAAALAIIPTGSELSLEQAEVTLSRAASNGDEVVVLAPVSIRVNNDDGAITLGGQLAHGEESLRLTLQWPAHSSVRHRASMQLTAREFDLDRIAPLLARGDRSFQGVITLDLNSVIEGVRVKTARGSIRARGLRLTANNVPPPEPLTINALLDYTQRDKGWELFLPRVGFGDSSDGPALGAARIARASNGHIQMSLQSIVIAELDSLVNAFAVDDAQPFLEHVRGGRIDDLELSLSDSEQGLRLDSLRARLHHIMLQQNNPVVTFSPLNASIDYTPARGRLAIHEWQLTLLHSQLREQRTISVSGDTVFSTDAEGITVAAHQLKLQDGDVRANLDGHLRWRPGETTVASDLVLHSQSLQSSQLVDYLSTGFASVSIEQWLRAAIHDAHITDVEISLLGTITSPIEVANKLRARARFDNLSLNYDPQWPKLTDVSGHVDFRQSQLSFAIERGQIAGNDIEQARVNVDDVTTTSAVIAIGATVSGTLERFTQLVMGSPLKPHFTRLNNQLATSGPGRVHLDVKLPFDGPHNQVSGKLEVDNAVVALSSMKSELKAVNGVISFNQDGPQQGRFHARFAGEPVSATVDGTHDDGKHASIIVNGHSTRAGLRRALVSMGVLSDSSEPKWLTRASGEADWQATLRVATHNNPDSIADIALRSDLVGMALDYPPPFGKSASQQRTLQIQTQLDASTQRLIHLAYAPQIQALLEIQPTHDTHRLTRGDIRFGGATAQLADSSGLTVSGYLPELSIDAWLDELARPDDPPHRGDGTTKLPVQAQLSTDRLNALGMALGKSTLTITQPIDGELQARVDGVRAAGSIRVPQTLSKSPISARFEKLHLPIATPKSNNEATSSRAQDASATTWPALDATIENLRYGDIELGRGSLALRPTPRGTAIETLSLDNDAYTLRGNGHWTGVTSGRQTELALTLHGEDLGKTLEALGYSNNGVKGAPIDASLDANWPGSPFDFSFATMAGTLSLRSGRGRFVDVEPGTTGRAFGLLSVTLLPRRIFRLDFSDLFGQGLGFRRIGGSFELKQGNAHIEQLTMDADTAEVSLVGRIGLTARDHDQIMTVVPKLSSSLPLAPLWLAEKVLDRKLLDPAFARRYTISGSWDAPEIERIVEPPPPAPQDPASR